MEEAPEGAGEVGRPRDGVGPPRDEVGPPRNEVELPADEPGARLARLRVLTRIMDDQVRIPGLGVRVGLDPVLGLLPGVGDVAGAAVSGWIVVSAARLGAPPAVVLRMLLNVGVDVLVGAIPLVGDLFDAGFKANRRNVRLLERHLDRGSGARERVRSRSRWVLLASAGGVVLFLLLLLVAVVLLGRAAWRAVG